jgi:hypothetical protein
MENQLHSTLTKFTLDQVSNWNLGWFFCNFVTYFGQNELLLGYATLAKLINQSKRIKLTQKNNPVTGFDLLGWFHTFYRLVLTTEKCLFYGLYFREQWMLGP